MKIITLGKYGALGNNFFRYVHLLCFTKDHNVRLYYSDRRNIDKFFWVDEQFGNNKQTPGWLNQEFFRYILKKIDKRPFWLKMINRVNIYVYDHTNLLNKDNQLMAASRKKNAVVFVLYDFRSHDSMKKYVEVVRKSFDIKSDLTQDVNAQYNTIRQRHKVLIGLHVRRGDYKDWNNGKYYFSDELFAKKVNEFIQFKGFSKEDVGIIICSNGDPEISNFPGLHVYFSKRPEHDDLFLMKRCDYILAPPSTFCSMSSFIGSVPLYFIENEEVQDFEERLHICSY